MTGTKKMLINSPETCVVDAIEGLVLSHSHLQRLEGYPQIKVVINRNHDKSKVALIAGGGSGHEPAHAGYVGEGMLAAAVCGDVFASPSTEAVLSAIRAVTGPAGCLLIVKNYTGDRLNFGLAAEQALSEGLAVEMVVVGEDTAIERPGLAGRRGLAGTVLVHKAAGAAAARGAPLSEVATVAQRVAGRMGTLGVGLTVGTLPGKPTSDRLGPDEVEVGLGIHGEPGNRRAPLAPPEVLLSDMMRHLAAGPWFRLLGERRRGVLLVNNLGTTPPLEMAIATKAALQSARRDLGLTVDRLYVGPYMTSLDMAGVSLTVLSYDVEGAEEGAGAPSWDELLQLLDAPTDAPGWPVRGAAVPAPYDPQTYSDVPAPLPAAPQQEAAGEADAAGSGPAGGGDAGAALGRALAAAAEALVAAAPELDAMDAKVGDGDCGSTVAGAARALLRDLGAGAIALHYPPQAAQQVARCVRSAVGGSSGALYDILITAAGRRLKAGPGGGSSPTTSDWAEALAEGLAAVQKYGRADRGCRTMLDALLPARDALLEAVANGADGATAAGAAAAAAEEGAAATRGMAAAAGRASYVPVEVLAATADPGAMAAAVWLRAVAGAVRAG